MWTQNRVGGNCRTVLSERQSVPRRADRPSSCFLCDPSADRVAFEFVDGIRRNPLCGRRMKSPDFPRSFQCRCPELRISFADLAQRPIHPLLHEVPLVVGASFDDRQEFEEFRVGGRFVVYGQHSHHHKPCPSDEFPLPSGPFHGNVIRPRSFVEQDAAGTIADSPIVEVAYPPVHQRSGHLSRICNHRCNCPGFVNTRGPELERKFVIRPDLFCERPDCRRRNTVGFCARNSKAGHPLDAAPAPF